MTYQVEVTDAAFDAIREQARYIAVECQAPINGSPLSSTGVGCNRCFGSQCPSAQRARGRCI